MNILFALTHHRKLVPSKTTRHHLLRVLPLLATLATALPASGQVHPFTTFDQVDPDYVMIAAHRHGYISNGTVTHPENSLSAAQDTIDLGVEILETDIKMTSDGGLVLMHDSSVNRTTNGSGTVSAMTLAQVRALHLLGPGGVVSSEIVPTLGELMALVKGKALVNLDHVDINNTTLRDNIMAVLQATDTVDHAIFKGGASAAQVAAMRAAFPGETIHYMPILSNSDETGMVNMLTSHTPPATELIFSSSPTTMLSAASVTTATSTDTHIWINSLWSSLCAGHHDAVALGGDPDGSWGWLIDKGATIIQTDNAPQMIPYLESLGLRGGDPVNRAPVANAQSVSTIENTPLSITLTGSDLDGDGLSFAVTVDPQHGILSGLAPELIYTPDAGYQGADDFSFKVNDGTVDSVGDAFVSITVGSTASPVIVGFDFDDGTRQGWTNVVTGGSGSNPNRFEARTDQGRGGGHSPDYSLLHDGDGSWLDGRDVAHDTLVVSSPPFDFDEASSANWAVSLFLLGGTGTTAAAPASLAALPASTATNGFMGVALRRVSDGAYLLHDHRDASGQYADWEEQGWNAAEISAAIVGDAPGETYQLDFIDQFHGGWGWVILDTVSILGVAPPEVELLVETGPLTTPGNQFIAIDHPLTDDAGDPGDIVASSGSLFLYGELRHGGGYAVLGLYPDATTATINGAIDFGRSSTASGFAAFDYLDNKGAGSATARTGGSPEVPIDGGVYTIIAEIDFDSPTTGTLRGWIFDGFYGSLDLASPNVETSFSSGFSTAPDEVFVRLGSGSSSTWANLSAVWAGDGTGATRAAAFAMLDPDQTYGGWALRNLDPSAPLLPGDDADGDGCANLLEYFGGSDPGVASSRSIYQTAGFDGDAPVFHYQRALDRPDVTGSLQWSTDLMIWHASGGNDGIRTIETIESVLSAPGSDPETIEATFQTSSGTIPQPLFVRLAVQ